MALLPTSISPQFPGVIALFLLLLSGFKIRVRTFIYAAEPVAAQIQRADPVPLAGGGPSRRACAVPAASSARGPVVRVLTADPQSEVRDDANWQ